MYYRVIGTVEKDRAEQRVGRRVIGTVICAMSQENAPLEVGTLSHVAVTNQCASLRVAH